MQVGEVALNQVFEMNGKRYKIINHPYVDGFALIQDHALIDGNFPHIDQKYIVNQATTIKDAFEAAQKLS